MNNIFDTHAHYTDPAFDGDREEVLASLPGKGIRLVMLASSSMEDTAANSALAGEWDYIYAAAGIHPENAGSVPADYLSFVEETILGHEKTLALGEIGLDYHYEGYDRQAQIRIFEEQLDLAKKLDVPVIIHSRDASEDTLSILREHRPRGVVHCFGGSAETAAEVLKLGMYIGFTGVITFKNAKKPLRALEAVPLERLVIETDCPYMAPVPFRGKRCDSSMLVSTAEKAAEIKGVSTQELIDQTCRNGMALYGING
ncbi:MAG: TatD family hydrolase [Ruminococcus sp.]|nr:TatD family hydrolase [Ruminococcus sp.]